MLFTLPMEQETKKQAGKALGFIFVLFLVSFALTYSLQKASVLIGDADALITPIRMTVYSLIVATIAFLGVTVATLFGVSLGQPKMPKLLSRIKSELLTTWMINIILVLVIDFILIKALNGNELLGVDYLSLMVIVIFAVSIVSAHRAYKVYYLEWVLDDENRAESQRSPLFSWRRDSELSKKENIKELFRAGVRQLFPKSTGWDNSTPKWFSIIILLNLTIFPIALWVLTRTGNTTVAWLISLTVAIQVLWWGVWALTVRIWNHKRRLLNNTRSLSPISTKEQTT